MKADAKRLFFEKCARQQRINARIVTIDGKANDASRNIAFTCGSWSKSGSNSVESPKHLPSIIFEHLDQLAAAFTLGGPGRSNAVSKPFVGQYYSGLI